MYSADREVIEECQARGFEITARQLERWRPLLPDRIVEHEEGFRGLCSVNPPGYVDQVVAIAETLKSGIPLREVPLALFLRGFSVRLEVLRAAISTSLPASTGGSHFLCSGRCLGERAC